MLFKSLNAEIRKTAFADRKLTLGEIVELAEKLEVRISDIVIAEAMIAHDMTHGQVIQAVLDAFNFNLLALEIGLSHGKSFLLGSIGRELQESRKRGTAVIGDRFVDKAIVYTMATEVGNHEVGLQPCAGTGDSCVYTGLLKALLETKLSRLEVGRLAALMVKIGTFFKEGKKTTGCNMEGFGAGAACTAAALTEMRKGSPRQVAKAIVLAISPTIAVPCTPRVIVSGLCATHLGGAVLIGNLAANLALKTSIAVPIDVDVMLAMAANIHAAAAPAITKVNLEYMRPYFKTEPIVDGFVAGGVLAAEKETGGNVLSRAREEIRKFAMSANPLISPFGEAVVGGSSIAVGSPTNMGRIAHELAGREVKKITIELTSDLFARRAINVPGILMGAVLGASTKDIKAYHNVLKEIAQRRIAVEVRHVAEPEVQRIRIDAGAQSAFVDAMNRGGGRLKLVDAIPSLAEAQNAAVRLGIKLAEA
ncbi:MAG: L-serine ammonia-lyase, iron-sulfur-dependent, subunit alpha [Gammaproteobacteria bacterium]|nr:L-serine ammonia-lyase, iron-sulfur-dependent, subunit alpha [Gammaproteobacteria bacterium]MDH3412821.1 L-serine ammonia-lyase, iron-sulfur-dependent, subunit alpha [Gammaproteobacteria bacterium]